MITELKEGDLVVVSQGAYSDYHVKCLCICTKNINSEEMISLSNTFPDDFFDRDKFISGLIVKGYLKELNCKNLHLGDYDLNPNIFDKL